MLTQPMVDAIVSFCQNNPGWSYIETFPDERVIACKMVNQQQTYLLNPEEPGTNFPVPKVYFPIRTITVVNVFYDQTKQQMLLTTNYSYSYLFDGPGQTVSTLFTTQ